MRVLVACEFSGVVRRAFKSLGHDAWSCDLLPAEDDASPHADCPDFLGHHVQGDVLKMVDSHPLLRPDWDLIIAHPPCTYLASSGARWWKQRRKEQSQAIAFFLVFPYINCPRVAIENPVGIMSTAWRKPDQIIQPYQFGHPEWKTTCLWLKGLPTLVPTAVVEPDATVGGGNRPGRISSRLHRMGPSKRRTRERSRTFTGIAAAMAAQWGAAP